MGFIDSEEGDGESAEKFQVLGFGQRFRRHIQHFSRAAGEVGLNFFDLFFAERGIQEVGNGICIAVAADQVDLVFHQGDQGGNDDGHPFADESRELVAEAFATAGGHDHKSVMSGQERFNGFFLLAFELVESKMGLQGLVQIESAAVSRCFFDFCCLYGRVFGHFLKQSGFDSVRSISYINRGGPEGLFSRVGEVSPQMPDFKGKNSVLRVV